MRDERYGYVQNKIEKKKNEITKLKHNKNNKFNIHYACAKVPAPMPLHA